MVTLINTSKNYSVTKETENFKLSGNAVIVEETQIISSFNGSINTISGDYCGNFSFNENESGRASKNIYDTDKENFAAVDALVDSAINELKEQLNDNE